MTFDLRDLDHLEDAGRLLFLRPITVTLRRPPSPLDPDGTAITVANVQEQPASQEEFDLSVDSSLDGVRRKFHLYAAECEAMAPSKGYEIETDDGTVWVIKSVETLAHGRRFRVQTVQRNDTRP